MPKEIIINRDTLYHKYIIEYDEKHHFRSKQQEKDIRRQNEIEEFLGCKFIRIKEKQYGTY